MNLYNMYYKNYILRLVRIIAVLTVFAMTLAGCAIKKDEHLIDARIVNADVKEVADNTMVANNPNPILSVPTQINYYDGLYFIVDCYNNKVVYSDDLQAPLYLWKVMTSDMKMGHTIASDGSVYLVDDTENNRVLIFEKYDNKFVETQILDGIGIRPHYIQYNEKNKTFYAWSSLTGQMYLIKRQEETGLVYVSDIKEIPELNGVYVRSFTIVDDDIYFVSGNSNVIQARLRDFKIKERYLVGPELAGMIQVMPVSDGYLITISTDANGDQSYATIIKTTRLENLINGEYEDIYNNFIGGGTPYYMSQINGRYFLTEHRIPGHSIWSFEYKDGKVCDVEAVF